MRMPYFFLMLLIVFPGVCFAQWWNPLAPKTFEECVLKNMKGVTSDSAANMISMACMNQFPQNSEQRSLGVVECHLYWDGRGFVKGDTPKGFAKFSFEYMGVKSLFLSFPRPMLPHVGLDNEPKGGSMRSAKWDAFFTQNYPTISSLCGY